MLEDLLAPFAQLPADVSSPLRQFDLSVDPAGVRVLERDGRVIVRSRSWEMAFGALLVELNREGIRNFAGFAVHAGAVATADAVLAFPGESGAGKSTLTAACLLAGFDYVSDEALCIDYASSHVVAYPKPLGLSRSGWAMIGGPARTATGVGVDDGEKVMLTSAELGARVSGTDLHLGHVIELARRDGPPRLVAQPRQRVLAQLLSLSFNHYKRPVASFDLVSSLAANCAGWRLDYSDPRSAAELLRTEFLVSDAEP